MNVFMRALYESEFWLVGAQKDRVIRAGRHFLQASSRLALLSLQLQEERFPVTPKHHLLFHIVKTTEWQSDLYGFSANPISEGCAQDEDFVGRLARICRAVSPRLTALRTSQRYLMQCKSIWYNTQ